MSSLPSSKSWNSWPASHTRECSGGAVGNLAVLEDSMVGEVVGSVMVGSAQVSCSLPNASSLRARDRGFDGTATDMA